MANCSQTNNTTIIGTSAVSYDSTPLPCTDVKACDDLNTILTKFDNVICSAINSVNILSEEVMNITEDLMIITEEIENINNQIFICCPICDFTITATELPVCEFTASATELPTCNFTGSVNQVPDPTTTTTTSASLTTTTTTTLPPCSYVLLADINGYILRYILATNTATTLFESAFNPRDLAHSHDKLWLNDLNNIYEYDITLSPWSQTFNRTISTGSVQTGFALGKPPGINNKLVTVDVSRSPGVIVELDITNSPATSVDIVTLPPGAVTPGDLLITDTVQPKILINLISVTSGADGLYQYDYNTGAFEIYVPLGPATSAFGIYEEGNLIYLVNGGGQTYSLLPTPPYTVTLVQTIPIVSPVSVIVGGSQLSECTGVILT
jgi:hypothetical protein